MPRAAQQQRQQTRRAALRGVPRLPAVRGQEDALHAGHGCVRAQAAEGAAVLQGPGEGAAQGGAVHQGAAQVHVLQRQARGGSHAAGRQQVRARGVPHRGVCGDAGVPVPAPKGCARGAVFEQAASQGVRCTYRGVTSVGASGVSCVDAYLIISSQMQVIGRRPFRARSSPSSQPASTTLEASPAP